MPLTTYRLQLRGGFGFEEARRVLPFLSSLGVTHVYASPFLMAQPGSTHGYDVVDPSRIDPEIGGEAGFLAFSDALRARGMGLLLDFVPNHMAASAGSNLWWRDVLENGPASSYASFFDIDWDAKPHLRHKVLLPILGEPYDVVLAQGHLRLALTDGWPTLKYFEHDLPLEPRSLAEPLLWAADRVRHSGDLRAAGALASVAEDLADAPPYTDATSTEHRTRRTRRAREGLARVFADSAQARTAVASAFAETDVARLHDLLERQPYRLAHWRTAAQEINYRRFFDIVGLVGVRMEEEKVFRAAHARIARLFAEGRLQGLRLDHVDGLFDPYEYLCRLRRTLREHGAVGAYVVVEKILSDEESLPADWPVEGTSGYDFLNDLGRLWVDPAGESGIDRAYCEHTGESRAFSALVHECKHLIMASSLSSELDRLTTRFDRIAKADPETPDPTWLDLRRALAEIVACFPRYRTYVRGAEAGEADRAVIDGAVAHARERAPALDPSIFSFVRGILVAPRNHEARAAVGLFQQYTGPVEAKGLEDTAFYRYPRLLSLCEVGGAPARFGAPPADFHVANAARLAAWPHSLLATSTHDTKRGEDARARLSVLSEIPEEWGRRLSRWHRLHASVRSRVEGTAAPDRADEYVLYQSLLAVWPAGTERADPGLIGRLRDAVIKAAREAKRRTSWVRPSEPYERALSSFLQAVLTGPTAAAFLQDFLPFAHGVARLGAFNSLAQVVLKATSPGVPDFYQGTELWDLTLVDPDNRRPVDFGRRGQWLTEIEPALDGSAPAAARAARIGDWVHSWRDGRIKLLVTAAVLRLRRHLTELFTHGGYLPIAAEGPRADHVVAFVRWHESATVLVAVPRLVATLAAPERLGLRMDPAAFEDTVLAVPPGPALRCAFTGERVSGRRVPVSDLFGALPVGLYSSESL